jgi:hypothetical protein
MSLSRISFVWAALAFIVTGCSDPELERIEPADVTRTTRSTITGHIAQIRDAVDLVAGAPFFTNLERIITARDVSGPWIRLNAQQIDELTDELNARVFHESAIEEQSDTRILYRLRSSRVCDGDERCVQLLDSVAVWLEVTSPAEGILEINVSVGERSTPLRISLSPQSVAVEVDVAALRLAAETLAPHFDVAPSDIAAMALGRFAVRLDKNAELDYTASLHVLETITVASDQPDQMFAASIGAKASPIASLRVDGATGRAFAQVDFAALDASIPSSMFLPGIVCGNDEEECGPFTGTLSAHIAGLSATVALHESLDRLVATNVGLGDSTSFVRLNETELLRANLNELNGRRFDVELSTFDDFVEAKLQSALTLDLGMDFAELHAQVPDLPTWTGGQNFSAMLEGSATPRVRFGDSSLHDVGGRNAHLVLEVLEGELTLGAEQYAPVGVSANSCLYFDHEHDDETHPFTGMISSTCF